MSGGQDAPGYLNSYKGPSTDYPPDIHASTPAEEYDQNFCFPLKVLRSDRVEIAPFVPSLHVEYLAKGVQANPEVLDYLPYKFDTVENARVAVEQLFRSSTTSMYNVIYSSPPGVWPPAPREEWEVAGFMAMINASVKDKMAEPGFIIILPKYQRTHVLTHAAGLMIHRILDTPEEGGLGLIRCQWNTNSLNSKSQAAALRLGFKHEGIIRAQRVLPPGFKGSRPGRPPHEENQTRDTWTASIIWEEWEGGTREHIDKLMARRS